jgi:hypothetical protein
MKTVIEMARESKLDIYGLGYPHDQFMERVKAFEALVRADERDRAMRENAYVQAEREACAKMCEEEICSCCWGEEVQAAVEHLAEAIRNRGKP